MSYVQKYSLGLRQVLTAYPNSNSSSLDEMIAHQFLLQVTLLGVPWQLWLPTTLPICCQKMAPAPGSRFTPLELPAQGTTPSQQTSRPACQTVGTSSMVKYQIQSQELYM